MLNSNRREKGAAGAGRREWDLFGIDNDPLPLPRLDVLERPLEVALRRLERRGLLVGLEIRLNELD